MGIFYDYTDSTYIVSTFDKVIKATITASGHVVSDWINEMILLIHRHNLDHLIVGLDLEWCPHGYHGTCGENPVALIQLCVGGRCLIFQLLNRDYIPVKFNDFLLDDRFRFVGVAIRDDLEKLKCQYGLEVRDAHDLRDIAAVKMGWQEMRQWGLPGLVWEVVGVRMEKPKRVRLSNWAMHVLSLEQIEYAVVDAFGSFEVGRRLYVGDYLRDEWLV